LRGTTEFNKRGCGVAELPAYRQETVSVGST
jgi:hypothetical protein